MYSIEGVEWCYQQELAPEDALMFPPSRVAPNPIDAELSGLP